MRFAISILTTLLVLSILGFSISFVLQQNLTKESNKKIIEEIYAIKYFEEVKKRASNYTQSNQELHSELLKNCQGNQNISLARTNTPLNCGTLSQTPPEDLLSFLHNSIIESQQKDISIQAEKNPLDNAIPYFFILVIFFSLTSVIFIVSIIYLSNPKLKSLKTLGFVFLITGIISILMSKIPVKNTSKLGEFGKSLITNIKQTIDFHFIVLGIVGAIILIIYFISRHMKNNYSSLNS